MPSLVPVLEVRSKNSWTTFKLCVSSTLNLVLSVLYLLASSAYGDQALSSRSPEAKFCVGEIIQGYTWVSPATPYEASIVVVWVSPAVESNPSDSPGCCAKYSASNV